MWNRAKLTIEQQSCLISRKRRMRAHTHTRAQTDVQSGRLHSAPLAVSIRLEIFAV